MFCFVLFCLKKKHTDTERRGSAPLTLQLFLSTFPFGNCHTHVLSKFHRREGRKSVPVIVIMKNTVSGSPKLKRLGVPSPHWLGLSLAAASQPYSELGPIELGRGN
jgi:hypothetical protein